MVVFGFYGLGGFVALLVHPALVVLSGVVGLWWFWCVTPTNRGDDA